MDRADKAKLSWTVGGVARVTWHFRELPFAVLWRVFPPKAVFGPWNFVRATQLRAARVDPDQRIFAEVTCGHIGRLTALSSQAAMTLSQFVHRSCISVPTPRIDIAFAF
jgi:hypothetical protein